MAPTRPTAWRRLSKSHNRKLHQLLLDNEYPKRTGITKDRLRAALFSPTQIRNASKNADFYGKDGRTALDQSSFQRLLVELEPRDKVIETVELLARLGCFDVEREGNYDAPKIYVSTGRVEKVFGLYLADLQREISQNSPEKPAETPLAEPGYVN